MKGIRNFVEADIPQVARLHNEVFVHPRPMTPTLLASYAEWLTAAFLNHPSRQPDLQSIVYEIEGELVGFLGVTARQFALHGRTYSATLSSNFVVSRKHRGGTGVAIYSTYLDMARDFAFVDEVVEGSRELHERLGMTISPIQSTRWVLPLRPLRRIVGLAASRLPLIARGPLLLTAGLLDAAARRIPRSPFRIPTPTLERRPLEVSELAQLNANFGGPEILRPVVTDGSTNWLIARARGMHRHGTLKLTSVHESAGKLVGWYVYYALPNKQSEVLQLAASRRYAAQVLDCLAHDAWTQGAVSISGTLHPWFLSPLAKRWAVFEPLTRWMLVKSRHPEITEAFLRGNLLLSRLDGEWCQHAE